MTKQVRMAGVATSMALEGCSAGGSSGLSEDDIHKALADALDRPSCMTDVAFTSFPVEPPPALFGNGHRDFDALVSAGLATKTGKVYALTPAGKAAFDPKRKGFCYSAGYRIVKVLDVAPIPDAQLGPVADKGWMVTLSIAQKPVADWVRTPAIQKRVLDPKDVSTEPKTYHVTLGQERGTEGIKRFDTMFHLPSGFSY